MESIKNVYLQGNKKAVLLLHSFTSNAKEMLYLAKELHTFGYTTYAPNLAGHGASPQHLFETSMDQIWEQSKKAVQFLIEEKYESIYIIGQSLGGVLSIRLANEFKEIDGLCIISSPVLERPVAGLEKRVEYFSTQYLKKQGSSEEELQSFLKEHFPRPVEKLLALQQFIVETAKVLHHVEQPLFLAKGALDETVFQQSIDIIEQNVLSEKIEKKLYENSGHLITLGKDRQSLCEDIMNFIK